MSEQDTFRGRLSSYAHDAWSRWMRYMFTCCKMNPDGSATIPRECVDRWMVQAHTSYEDLPESAKPSDRQEAEEIMVVAREWQRDVITRCAASQ